VKGVSVAALLAGRNHVRKGHLPRGVSRNGDSLDADN